MVAGLSWDAREAEEGRIQEFARQVEEIWRKTRPNIVRLYDRMQQTESRTREAARLWRTNAELFHRNGVPRDQANHLAMYEFVYLPDIEPEEEAAVLTHLQRPRQAS